MSDVKITTKHIQFKEKHTYNAPDAFGFGATAITYDIHMRLNLRAYVILKEEYPMVIPFMKAEPKTKTYLLKITVNDLKPITRFVFGLVDDVEVLGSIDFKAHLTKLANQLLTNTINKETKK